LNLATVANLALMEQDARRSRVQSFLSIKLAIEMEEFCQTNFLWVYGLLIDLMSEGQFTRASRVDWFV